MGPEGAVALGTWVPVQESGAEEGEHGQGRAAGGSGEVWIPLLPFPPPHFGLVLQWDLQVAVPCDQSGNGTRF